MATPTKFDNDCLQLAISLAEESKRKGGLPFGAVLAKDGEVMQQSIDRRSYQNDPTAHAEMCVIREHCWANGLKYLKGYAIYCSTEPCVMCSGAIRSSRISKVFFSISQDMLQQFSGGISKGKCEEILSYSREPIEIIGPVLADIGATVFDGYEFSDKIPAGSIAATASSEGKRTFHARHIDWTRRLRAIGQNGKLYAETLYHRERYEAIIHIAEEILAEASVFDPVKLHRIPLLSNDYETPKIDVRAAVSRRNKLLFVKEADDRCWSLPGGWVEVGETPRQSVEKEVFDESGFRVRAKRLLGVFDKDRHAPVPTSVSQVITFFFECEITEPHAETIALETTDFKFCSPDEIPELSPGRVPIELVHRIYQLIEVREQSTQFD